MQGAVRLLLLLLVPRGSCAHSLQVVSRKACQPMSSALRFGDAQRSQGRAAGQGSMPSAQLDTVCIRLCAAAVGLQAGTSRDAHRSSAVQVGAD